MYAVQIASVNIGLPQSIGIRRGREVISSIHKLPVTVPSLELTSIGLVGDTQTDRRLSKGERIHGGPLKAVYMYPLVHYMSWQTELQRTLTPGELGDNLTLHDITEGDVHIGDIFGWGDTVLQVTEPRRPCYKLDLHLGIARAMVENGRCGWYCQVLAPGTVPTTGHITLLSQATDQPTVLEVFRAKMKARPEIPDMPD